MAQADCAWVFLFCQRIPTILKDMGFSDIPVTSPKNTWSIIGSSPFHMRPSICAACLVRKIWGMLLSAHRPRSQPLSQSRPLCHGLRCCQDSLPYSALAFLPFDSIYLAVLCILPILGGRSFVLRPCSSTKGIWWIIRWKDWRGSGQQRPWFKERCDEKTS